MISYLIHASILVGGCFLFYQILLRKETYYKLNRWFLLGSIVIAVTLPLLKIPQDLSLNESRTIEKVFVENTNNHANNSAVKTKSKISQNNVTKDTEAVSILTVITYIYMGGVVLFLSAFLIQFSILFYRKRKLEFIQDGNYKIYELTNDSPPFSFYKWIFINPSLYEYETYEQIIAHEKIHIKQFHFIDTFITELAIIFFWFNPFMWYLRNAITNNLEFLTDDQMLLDGAEPESYQVNLLKVSVPQHPLNITINYNQSILQKRIVMMNLKKSSAKSSWKYLALIPLLLFSVTQLNATYQRSNNNVLPVQGSKDADKVHRELITKELSFADASDENLLSIDNITGAITVEGYSGSKVLVEVEKVIIAKTQKELQRGIDEMKVELVASDHENYLYLDSPYSKFDTTTHEFSYRNNCDNEPCFSYQFQLHYTIKVPFNTNLKLSTLNGGDIKVKEVSGKQLIAKHISGSIYLENIASATDAFTISGGITASYTKNPMAQSSYITTSGHIEVEYKEGLDAKVTYEIKDGKLLTDFEAVSLNRKSKESLKSPVKIGSGDIDLYFKTTSGNVYLNKN